MRAGADTARGDERATLVTERVQAAALSSIANAVMITRTDGTIVWINAAFTAMSGFRAEEALGATPRLLKSGVQGPEHYAALWATILAGRTWRGEVVNRHRDGHHYTVRQTITPVVDAGDHVTRFVAVHENVTELRASQARMQALFDHALDAILLFDDHGQMVEANPAVCALTGYATEDLATMTLVDVLPASQRDAFRQAWQALMDEGTARGSLPIRRRDGAEVVVEYQAVTNIVPGVHLLMGRDVTAQRRAAEQQRSQARLLSRRAAQQTTAAELGRWALSTDNPDAVALRARRHARALLGPDIEVELAAHDAGPAPGGVQPGRALVVRGQGVPALAAQDIEYVRALGNIVDAAYAREQARRQLEYLATHDPLTGLMNRTRFLQRLEEARRACAQSGGRFAVAFLDLDRFKFVNDRLGRETGDEVLRLVAGRLRDAVRPGDSVARFGGDEFAVLFPGLHADDAATGLAGRIHRVLAGGVRAPGANVSVTASIGVVVGGSATEAGALLGDADTAMYWAKDSGRNRVELFDRRMTDAARRRSAVASALHDALATGGVIVHYQPIVELATGRLAGVEALVRLGTHADMGIGPDELVHAAEETGLIDALDGEVLRQACSDGRAWLAVDPTFSLSVNISAHELGQRGFAERVERIVATSGIDPSRLCLEITESASLGGRDVEAVMGRLRTRGLRFAIDDFGTGYSSLAQLRQLPVDSLKIDRGFVSGLHADIQDRALVTAAIGLAGALGLSTTAEGVETTEQRDALVGLGCTFAQGYLWSPPVPPAQIARLLRAPWGDVSG